MCLLIEYYGHFPPIFYTKGAQIYWIDWIIVKCHILVPNLINVTNGWTLDTAPLLERSNIPDDGFIHNSTSPENSSD